MSEPHGLRERIKRAKTEQEVTELLAEGKTYTWASAKTRRHWEATAKAWQAPVKKTEKVEKQAKKAG